MRVSDGFRLTYPLFLWITLTSACCAGEAMSGRVVGVSDGDTLKLLSNDRVEHVIRLAAIDAPEIGHGKSKPGQPYGMRSKAKLAEMCFGRVATVELSSGKTYGRLIGYVHCDGKDANLEMLNAGLAWVYPQYNKGVRRIQFERAEEKAKASKIGLWASPSPVSPWEHRHGGGE